jgi:hypothetical protein
VFSLEKVSAAYKKVLLGYDFYGYNYIFSKRISSLSEITAIIPLIWISFALKNFL